jgi:hypothetical protein
MDAIGSVLVGLLGTIIGAALACLSGTRQHRLAETFQLHREFNSAEMIESRYRAGQLLEANATKTLNEVRSEVGTSVMHDVWNVVLFYQRLALAIRYRGVHEKYVPGLLGEIFDWWYIQSFRHQLLPIGNQLAHDIEGLHSWISSHTPPHQLRQWRAGHIFWPIDDNGTLPSA